MKKVLLALAMTAMTALCAHAQFESGKQYYGASLSGLGVSYSDRNQFSFGAAAQAGLMVADDVLLMGEAGVDYGNSAWRSIYIGGKCRYYIEENGIFLGAGARLKHEFKNYNDFQITPEVGYCYFVSRHVSIEPSIYFNLSCTDFSHNSEVGLKVGLGLYF